MREWIISSPLSKETLSPALSASTSARPSQPLHPQHGSPSDQSPPVASYLFLWLCVSKGPSCLEDLPLFSSVHIHFLQYQLPPPLENLPSDKGAGLRPVCPLPSAKLPIPPQPQAKFSIVLGRSGWMMIDNDDDNVLDLITKTADTLGALSMCQEPC